MDLLIFHSINNFALRWFWLGALGIFCANYLGYVLEIGLFVLLFLNFKKYWPMVWQATVAAFLARVVVAELFYHFLPRSRPFVNFPVHLLFPGYPATPSFPSGHAAFYFALAIVVYFYNKKPAFGFLPEVFLLLLLVFLRGFIGPRTCWLVL